MMTFRIIMHVGDGLLAVHSMSVLGTPEARNVLLSLRMAHVTDLALIVHVLE